MKKFITATLAAGLLMSAGAYAEPTAVKLTANTYKAIAAVGDDINLARQFLIQAIDGRAGFVKNDFEATLSANVIAGAFDNAANNRMGVVAASNKGYTVFTGSSVGGSVSQCGKTIAKGSDTDANLAASLVVGGTLDLTKANGCNRTL